MILGSIAILFLDVSIIYILKHVLQKTGFPIVSAIFIYTLDIDLKETAVCLNTLTWTKPLFVYKDIDLKKIAIYLKKKKNRKDTLVHQN